MTQSAHEQNEQQERAYPYWYESELFYDVLRKVDIANDVKLDLRNFMNLELHSLFYRYEEHDNLGRSLQSVKVFDIRNELQVGNDAPNKVHHHSKEDLEEKW